MAKKTSNTEVGIVSPITAYSNSKEAATVSPALANIIRANIVGSNVSINLEDDDIDLEAKVVASEDPDLKEKPEETTQNQLSKKAPTLMDIELVSKSISYSTSGIPSVSVIFKVRNSSGESVTSVRARVQA